MKRFWLFAGDSNAIGGMRDFVGCFDDSAAAQETAKKLKGTKTNHRRGVYRWWQVFDSHLAIVDSFGPRNHERYYLGKTFDVPRLVSAEPPAEDPFERCQDGQIEATEN